MPPPTDKTKVLYDAVSSEYNLGSYDDFKNKLADPTKRKAFYDAVGAKYNLGAYDEFQQKVGHQEPSIPSAQQQGLDLGIKPVGTYQPQQPASMKSYLEGAPQPTIQQQKLPASPAAIVKVGKTNKPDIKEAIDNAVIERNKQYGVHDKPDMNFGRDEIIKKYKNGDLVPDFDSEGKSVMKKTTGLFDSFVNAVNKASVEHADNVNLEGLDTEGKIKYLEAKRILDAKDDNTKPSPLGQVGEFAGSNADMLAKTTVGAMTGGALAPEFIGAGHLGGFLSTVKDFATGGGQGLMQKTYYDLKKQGVPDTEAMKQAEKTVPLGAATGIATGAILSGVPKLNPDKAIVEDFVTHLIKTSKKLGAVSGGEAGVNDLGEIGAGVHKSFGDVVKDVGEGTAHGIGTALAFETLLNIHKVPSAIYNKAREVVASIPEGVRDEFINDAVQSGQLPKEKAEEIKSAISVVRPEEMNKPEAVTIAPKEGIPTEEKRGAAIVLPESNKEPNIVDVKPTPTNEEAQPQENKSATEEVKAKESGAETVGGSIPNKTDGKESGVGGNVGGNITFKTAKGSTYKFDDDGTTTRDKAYRPEHGIKEQGAQPKSEKTFFITKEQGDKLSIVQATHPDDNTKFVIATLPDGKIGVGMIGGKSHGKLVANTTIEPKTSPELGLMPLEIWEGGKGHHFGNEITEISKPNTEVPKADIKNESDNRATTSSTEKAVPENEGQSEVQGNESEVQGSADEVGRGNAEPPTADVGEGGGNKGEPVDITHAGTDKLAEELGLPDRYEKDPTTRAAQDAEAAKRVANGEIPELIKKLENKDMPSAVEQRMMAQHLGNLKAEYEKTKSDKTLLEIKRLKELSDRVGGRDVATSLQARQANVHPLEGGEASAKVARMEALGVDKLTDKQKEEVEKMVNEYKTIADNEKAKREEIEKKFDEFVAEKELEKLKSENKKSVRATNKKKTKDEFTSERVSIIDSIKDKWKNAGNDGTLTAVPIPYAKQLAAIAPDVVKLVKSLLDEGIGKLDEIVAKAHETVKEAIPEITERDIRDVIAGKYNKKQETKNELQAKWEDVRQEQKLLDELAGELAKKPKNEKEETVRNQRLSDLRKAIGEKRMAEIDAAKHESKISDLNEELERVRSRKAKEPSVKGEPKSVSPEEQEILDKIDAEQEKWDAEKDAARQAKRDYQKIETERNRQLKRVAELKEKLATLQKGELPEGKPNQPKVDTPEIEALKKEIDETEKSVRENISHEKKMKDLSDELQRLKDRKEKEKKPENEKKLSDDERDLRDKIDAERKSWNAEKSRDNRIKSLEKQLQDLKNRKAKDKSVKPETIDPEIKKLEDDIKSEREAWAHEKKMDALEVELQRIKDRKVKDKKDKREIVGEEKQKRDEIDTEQKAWDTEKNIEKLKGELQRVRDRKAKETKPQKRKELTALEKELVGQIFDEKKVWDKEVEPERKLLQEIKATEKSIADYEQKIADKNVDGKEPAKKLSSPKLEQLKKRKKELQKQYKKLKDDLGVTDIQKIKNIIRANNAAKLKYLQRIADGKFSEEKPVPFSENFEFKRKYPELFKEAMEAIQQKNDAKTAFDIALTNDKIAKESRLQKTVRWFGKAKNTLQSMVAGVDDSLMFVQLGYTILTNAGDAVNFKFIKDANGKTKIVMGGAIKEHVLDAWSKGRFDRQMTAMHESAFWPLIKASELDVLEPMSLLDRQKEEMFQQNLAHYVGIGTIPMGEKLSIGNSKLKNVNLGKFLEIWERAYTSLGNNMRVSMFLRQAKVMYESGMTIENNLEEFKGLARAINNLTGRGSMNPVAAQIVPYTTAFIWSPKMIASSINLLGISDILSGGHAGFYSKLPPKAKAYAARQMADGIAISIGAMVAAAIAGYTVHYSPHDKRWGEIEYGENNSKSWNVWGRYSSMMRLIVQLLPSWLGGGTQDKNGNVVGIDENGGKTRATAIGGYLRGKANPIAGLAYDYVMNDKKGYYDNKPLTAGNAVKEVTIPMSLRDVRKELDRDGTLSLLNYTLPNFTGLSMKDQRDYYSNQTGEKYVDTFLEKNKLKVPSVATVSAPKDKENPTGKATDEQVEQITKLRDEQVKSELDRAIKDKFIKDGDPKNADRIKKISEEALKDAKTKVFGKQPLDIDKKINDAQEEAKWKLFKIGKG